MAVISSSLFLAASLRNPFWVFFFYCILDVFLYFPVSPLYFAFLYCTYAGWLNTKWLSCRCGSKIHHPWLKILLCILKLFLLHLIFHFYTTFIGKSIIIGHPLLLLSFCLFSPVSLIFIQMFLFTTICITYVCCCCFFHAFYSCIIICYFSWSCYSSNTTLSVWHQQFLSFFIFLFYFYILNTLWYSLTMCRFCFFPLCLTAACCLAIYSHLTTASVPSWLWSCI